MDVLFVYKQIADETILSYGTIKKLKAQGHSISLVTVTFDNSRLKPFFDVVDDLGITTYCNCANEISKSSVAEYLKTSISGLNPAFVITHSLTDPDSENRLISTTLLDIINSSNSTSVKKFWATSNVISAYGSQASSQNVFIDISSEIQNKMTALKKYFSPTSKIPTSVFLKNKLDGECTGNEFCESFTQIFEVI